MDFCLNPATITDDIRAAGLLQPEGDGSAGERRLERGLRRAQHCPRHPGDRQHPAPSRSVRAGVARPADNRTVIIEFLVDDVDGVHQNLAGFVEDFVQELATMPWGNRSPPFRDPDGNLATFINPVTPAAIEKFAR